MGGCFEGWDFGRASCMGMRCWMSCMHKGGILDGGLF